MAAQFVPTMGNTAIALTDRAVRGRVVAAGDNFQAVGSVIKSDLRNAANDWALIELDRPILNIEPFKILHPGPALAPDTLLSAVGYTANRQCCLLTSTRTARCERIFTRITGFPTF